ncbi:glycosyltransferase family 2 protein [Inquilinus sp. KBS0705]|nr:glycosyltransferase family 2 protein [Inquilinus sp. KBS0705]
MKKSVSIIIPNYNGRQLLEAYLPYTIEAIKNAGVTYEIIVVDDQSKDESVSYLQNNYHQVKLIVNAENKGFSYTCNRGIDAAQYDLILLLNSDVKLTADYFEHQWKYFTKPDIFGVMGRIIDMEGDHIQDAARIPKFNGLKLKTAYFYYSDKPGDELYTFYLSGANALVDAKKLKQLGGFYELFSPFYCEDIELSLRAWRMGYKCYYEHRAICRHQMSASTKNYQTARWVKSVYYRNRFYLHALHLSGLARLGWFMQITFIDLLPKLLVGQIWIWKSYTGLFRNSKQIKSYQNRLEKLLGDKHQSIFDVVKYLKKSVESKQITRFKP